MLKYKIFSAIATITIIVMINSSGQVIAQSRSQLWDLCYNQNNQQACDDWRDSIHKKMDEILAPIDHPELRKFTLRCRQGDVRACNAEIAWRRSITRGYQNAINTMNKIYGPSWKRSFGLGG